MNKKRVLISLISLFLLPSVHALNSPVKMPNFLSNLGTGFWELTQNEYAVYFFSFVFFFILLYAIFVSALGKLKLFDGADKQKKMVAVSLSMLSCLSIFYLTREHGIKAFLARILGPFGIFAGIALALIVFMMFYYGIGGKDGPKDWKTALLAAGIAMILLGIILNNPDILWWGVLLALIGAVALLSKGFKGFKGPGGEKDPGGERGPGEDMGPIKRKYHTPNLVPNIKLCTIPGEEPEEPEEEVEKEEPVQQTEKEIILSNYQRLSELSKKHGFPPPKEPEEIKPQTKGLFQRLFPKKKGGETEPKETEPKEPEPRVEEIPPVI